MLQSGLDLMLLVKSLGNPNTMKFTKLISSNNSELALNVGF